MKTKELIKKLQTLDPKGNGDVYLNNVGQPLIYSVDVNKEGNILLSADFPEDFEY